MSGNPWPWAFAAVAVLLAGRAALLARRLRAAEAELARLRAAPAELEFRVERFEALWFPIVGFRREAKEIAQVRPGAPHCPACVRPLAAAARGGDWFCPGCGVRRTANLGTLSVADTVCQEALRFFDERHPGYRRPPKAGG